MAIRQDTVSNITYQLNRDALLGSIAGPIGSAVGTFAGGAIGGLATGYAGSKVASAVGNELAQHSDTIKSFADASQALPQYDAAGNLVSMVVPGAAGLVNLGRVGAIRAAEMGVPAALKLTAKEARSAGCRRRGV